MQDRDNRIRAALIHARRIALVLLLVGVGIWGYREWRWKQFAVVAPGKIYRSGLLKEHQLESAIQSLGLRTVICLVPEQSATESAICERLGVRFRSYQMHSSGAGDPADYAEVVRTLSDPVCQPVLVHCQAGVARTGAAVALYRMSVEGWTFDQAITELRGFERKGRCEQSLQDLIARTYRENLLPKTAQRTDQSAK